MDPCRYGRTIELGSLILVDCSESGGQPLESSQVLARSGMLG
jgi:hypothetical protein